MVSRRAAFFLILPAAAFTRRGPALSPLTMLLNRLPPTPSATHSHRALLAVRIVPVIAGQILTTKIHHLLNWGVRVLLV